MAIDLSKRLKQAAIIFIVILAAAQLVRPERVNPPTRSVALYI